jgi:hypothetical protein
MPTAGGTTGFGAGAGTSAGAGFDGSGVLHAVSIATTATARLLDGVIVHPPPVERISTSQIVTEDNAIPCGDEVIELTPASKNLRAQ